MSGNKNAQKYHSFRLILGEVGRAVAAYAGNGVYLDVALGWVAGNPVSAHVPLRNELNRPSGYNFSKLLSHFLVNGSNLRNEGSARRRCHRFRSFIIRSTGSYFLSGKPVSWWNLAGDMATWLGLLDSYNADFGRSVAFIFGHRGGILGRRG